MAVMPAVSALPPAAATRAAATPAVATSAIPLTALPPVPERLEAEQRRLEIDNMVAADPEKAADYLRSLLDDRQTV